MAPAPEGLPESLEMEVGVKGGPRGGRQEAFHSMHTYPELPGMNRADGIEIGSTSSSSSSLNERKVTLSTTWASKQYRAPGRNPDADGGDRLHKPLAKELKAHVFCHFLQEVNSVAD